MSRHAYLVSYDIADDRRRTHIHELCRGYGERLQYSVFRCDMSRTERVELESALSEAIHHEEDQILVIDLGPMEGRAQWCVRAMGKPYTPPDGGPVIL